MNIQPISQVRSRAVTWLWPGALGVGQLGLLSGDPGLGKSFVALDLCARLSTNRPLPDGSTFPGPGNCLYLFTEDSAAETIAPRLARLGADTKRVFIPNLEEAPWSFPSHIPQLENAIRDCRARLVVIDPIMAFLDRKVNAHNDQSLRRLFTPLKRVAERCGCAMLLIRHLNKAMGMHTLYRGAGSIAFSAACRVEWLVAKSPTPHARCLLAQQKNNNGPLQRSLAFELRTSSSTTDGQSVLRGATPKQGMPELIWYGVSDWTAQDLIARRRPNRKTLVQEAMDFLRAYLHDPPKTSRQVWVAAQKQGFREKTIRSAADQLRLVYHRVYVPRDCLSYWLLPGQAPPPADPDTDLSPWLDPLMEKYPSASPLDDAA